MEEAGSRATPARPLASLGLENERASFRHALKARFWPGGGEPVRLAKAHPHGAWIEWLDEA